MKVVVRNILVCFLILSPAPCRAVSPTYSHNFNEMWRSIPQILVLSNSNKTGTVARDKITYTCSEEASFFLDERKTNNELAIFLENSNDAQVTTSLIQNLDSIVVRYVTSSTQKRIAFFYLKEGEDKWKELETEQVLGTIAKSIKMPSVGNYYVRFKRRTDDVYIKEIVYFFKTPSPDCPNCFVYTPE